MSDADERPDCPLCDHPRLAGTLVALLVGAIVLQVVLLWLHFA